MICTKALRQQALGWHPTLLGIPKAFGQTSVGTNRIRSENAKSGTRDWMLTKTDITDDEPVELWRSPRIEGYCSETSVRAGDTIKIMVSTNPVSEFSLEIFRTGYYGGDGGRFMKRFDSIQGKTQADPPIGENRLRECKWEPSLEFEIPEDWLSGVYLGKLTAKKEGVQSYVIFIVRDDRLCDLLFQCSDMTWQAYNSLAHQRVFSVPQSQEWLHGLQEKKEVEHQRERYRVGEF